MGSRLVDHDHSGLSDGFESDGPERHTNTCYSMMHEASGQLSLLDEGIMGSNPRCPEKWNMINMEDEREMGDVVDTADDTGIHPLKGNSLKKGDDILQESEKHDDSHAIRGRHDGSSGPSEYSEDAVALRSRQNDTSGTSTQGVGTIKTGQDSSNNPFVASTVDVSPQEIVSGHGDKPKVGAVPRTSTGHPGDVPPVRRRTRETPYIQAGDLTLTYAQAKLFGLTVPMSSPPSSIALTNVLKATRKSSCFESRVASSSSCGRPRGQTYSVSRMEHMAMPLSSRRGREKRGNRYEATFTWKRSRKAEAAMRDPACGYDFVRDEGSGGQQEFLRRVEASASYRRSNLQETRAIQEYAARLDKLECPRCHNPQSYDEFASKKSKCPGCNLEYRLPRTWKRNVWEQRNQRYLAKSEERRERVKRQVEEELLESMPSLTRQGALLRQRVGKVAFLRRMRNDLERRRKREATLLLNNSGRDYLLPVSSPS